MIFIRRAYPIFRVINSLFIGIFLMWLSSCSEDESPTIGAINMQVIIEGNGFNPVASENTVKFNGIVSPDISATENRLVPSGATTGLITVTTNEQTAIGPQFTVVVEAMHASGNQFESGFGIGCRSIGEYLCNRIVQ